MEKSKKTIVLGGLLMVGATLCAGLQMRMPLVAAQQAGDSVVAEKRGVCKAISTVTTGAKMPTAAYQSR